MSFFVLFLVLANMGALAMLTPGALAGDKFQMGAMIFCSFSLGWASMALLATSALV